MGGSETSQGGANSQKSSLHNRTKFVYTSVVKQNITFSADKSDIELAREEAQSRNTTLHELFRDWLKGIAGRRSRVQELSLIHIYAAPIGMRSGLQHHVE